MKIFSILDNLIGLPQRIVILGLAGTLLFGGAKSFLSARENSGIRDRLNTRVSELVIDVAEADGIATIEADRNRSLLNDLADSRSSLAAVADELRVVNAQNILYAKIIAELETKVTALGEMRLKIGPRDCVECLIVGDTISGFISDPVFDIGWVFTPMNKLTLDPLRARIDVDLLTSTLPNGAIRIFGKAKDLRINLRIPQLEFKPSRAQKTGFPWGTSAKSFLFGLGVGYIGYQAIR